MAAALLERLELLRPEARKGLPKRREYERHGQIRVNHGARYMCNRGYAQSSTSRMRHDDEVASARP
jgi:hypothetical protein